MRLTKIFVSCALVFVFTAIAIGQNYQKPTGFVNDWANLLPTDTKNTLENKLRDYEKQTSIEIAVVVTPSLGEKSVEEYTVELAQEWGVGKKGKDNGIVFLIAPNDRKLRIEVGYGMEPDLTDFQAGRIRDEIILPHFKEAKLAKEQGDSEAYTREMTAGITAGTDAIIGTLGNKPIAERLEERRLAEEKKKKEEAEFNKLFGKVVMGLIILLAVGAAAFFIVRAIANAARERKLLQDMNSENARSLHRALVALNELQNSEYKKALDVFEKIKKENPKEVWEKTEKSLATVPRLINEAKKRHAESEKDYVKGWQYARETSGKIEDIDRPINSSAKIFTEVNGLASDIARARNQAPRLMESFPESLANLEKKMSHRDVFSDVKPKIKEANDKYQKAKKLAGDDSINWLLVCSLAVMATNLLSDADKKVAENIKEVASARKDIPTITKEIPKLTDKAEKAVDHEDVSEETKKMVNDAKHKFMEAEKRNDGTPIGLVATLALLVAAKTLLSNAENQAEEEIEEEKRRRRRRSSSSYSSSGSWSSGSSSSSSYDFGGSSSSSSFGGFGGGGFGGGGASGGW